MERSVVAQPAALLEREHELERVRLALRAAGRQDGGVLVIEGAAGVGKSRLLREARVWGSDEGLRVLHARATELERGFPFGVVRQLFERLLADADIEQRERWLAGAAGLAAHVITGAVAPGPAQLVPSLGDPEYAWQHGLYWLASNISTDAPLALVVDDLQWCDAPSARALMFIARRLEGQALVMIVASRPLDPALAPEAAALVADPAAESLRPLPLTAAAIASLIATRLHAEAHERFVRACRNATGGNPFLVGELLGEVAVRGLDPSAAEAAEAAAIVPRGVANAVLLRLARLPPATLALARALSVLGDRAQMGDAARLAELDGTEIEAAMPELVSFSVVEPGGTITFTHPMVRSAIYGDLSPAERERLHHGAARVLRERGAGVGQIAAQVMPTEPAADLGSVAVLRDAAREALTLGDAHAAAALLDRALEEPPGDGLREAVLLELGQARARTGAPEAIPPLVAIVEQGENPAAIASAANDLSGMFLYAARAGEAAAILGRARDRLAADGPERNQLQAALLGLSYVSASARRESDSMIASLPEPDRSARGMLPATTLATLAMDEVMFLRSATRAIELAERALTVGLPVEPRREGDWVILALGALTLADRLDVAERVTGEILTEGRRRGAALTVATISGLRSAIEGRRGDLAAAEADAFAAIELAPDLLGSEFVLLLAVPAAVFVGLEREESPASLRRLIDRTGALGDTEFLASSQIRYASGLLRAATGNHEAAVEELRGCAVGHPAFGGENPAVLPWRSTAALSLLELGRRDEARGLADDELQRAQLFGAARAIGIALRAQALVGSSRERAEGLAAAAEVLARSPTHLEYARTLVDLGATLRAAGQRTAAREPLLEALELAARCGARSLERRARAELAAVGVRPRATDRWGVDSLTPSERRVTELAAAGGTNREIAQTLFVTEKTVETHLGRAFRKLDISSRRQLAEVLADAG